jgi:hypothetical protein
MRKSGEIKIGTGVQITDPSLQLFPTKGGVGVLAECDAEGPDVLGDTAMLPLHNARLPEIVQEAGLPVVNMAHDGHNRWPWHQHTWIWWSCFHCVLQEANQNKT